jgi:ATP-grasp domain-containing protein
MFSGMHQGRGEQTTRPPYGERLSPRSRWVLVTDHGDVGSRTSLGAVRAVHAGGYRAAMTTTGRPSLAGSSRYCERRVTVPALDGDAYAEAVLTEVESRPYVNVLPASDLSLLALGVPGAGLIDKSALNDAAAAAGVPVPPSRTFAGRTELLDAAGELEYPVAVKALVPGHAAFRAGSPDDLAAKAGAGVPVMVQPYLREPLRAIGGVSWRGRLVAAVHQRYHRTWPPDCGGASAAVSVEPDPAVEESVMRLLATHDGIFMAQFLGPYLIDLNLRVYGSLPLAVASGANLVQIHCDLLRGEEVAEVRGRPGVRYRWLEGDLRRLGRAFRDRDSGSLGGAARALLPHRGTAHSMISLSDPRPMLLRLGRAFTRLAHGRRA